MNKDLKMILDLVKLKINLKFSFTYKCKVQKIKSAVHTSCCARRKKYGTSPFRRMYINVLACWKMEPSHRAAAAAAATLPLCLARSSPRVAMYKLIMRGRVLPKLGDEANFPGGEQTNGKGLGRLPFLSLDASPFSQSRLKLLPLSSPQFLPTLVAAAPRPSFSRRILR